ncbi:ABC transporter permease [Streptomyces salinarius]|uniref:ABC transporter permease n=1 Tax=Streptomyces salinarius TaxID=2762598 RepID=UPI0013DD3D57|nr:ABC transporter permease [Streptomyces salinarius]
MLRTALRNVFAHKARLLMTVLAVMLGVAFVSGTLVFTSTISDAYQKSSQKGFAGKDVVIRPHHADGAPEPPDLPQSSLDRLRRAPGAASVVGAVDGYVAIADKDGDLLSENSTSHGANYFAGEGREDSRYPMKSGRAPRTAGEVALDAETAARGGYDVGDTVPLSIAGPVLKQRLTGIFTTDDGNVAAGGSLALFDTATAQKLYARPGEFNEIVAKAKPGVSQATLKAQLDKLLPENAKATTGKKLADDEAEDIARSMDGMRTGMLAFAGIALFVGAFIIVNTFTMLVGQRTKELALLRAVGATRRQVTRSVLLEALAVGALAGVVGLPAGIGIGALMRSLIGRTGTSVPDGPLVVPSSAVIASLLIALGVTTLSAWLPGRRAAKVPPVAAMNSVHADAGTRSLVVRNTIGALLAAGGIAVSATSGSNETLGLGALLLVIGVFVLTPLLSRPVISAAAPLLRPFGTIGKLARQNAVRNPRRTAATASALMVGLTLITGLTVIANGVQQAIDRMAADALKADFVVVMSNMRDLSPEIAERLAEQPDVDLTSPMRPVPVRIGNDDESLTGVDGKTIDDLIKVDFTAGSLAGLTGDKAVVDTDTAEKYGWKLGSSFTVSYEDGERGTLRVSGIYRGNQMIQGVMLDNATATPHLTKVVDRQVMVKSTSGDSGAVGDRLYEALGSNPALQIQTKADISREVAQVISLMLNILYGLLAMAVIVAVLGVVNTLALSVTERQREIGMLRAIGVSRQGVQRMVRLESVVISLFGGLLGVVLGVFFAWAVGEQIGAGMPTYELAVPWGSLIVFLLLSAAVGVLAALWPARRAARTQVLDAIKAG